MSTKGYSSSAKYTNIKYTDKMPGNSKYNLLIFPDAVNGFFVSVMFVFIFILKANYSVV